MADVDMGYVQPLEQTRQAGTFVGIERMRLATFLVGGIGAIGNEVVKNLAMMSPGRLILVDFDHIEASNLSRSVFFSFGDRGRALAGASKVDYVADMVRRIDPSIEVVTFCGDIADLGVEALREVDVAFSCFDQILPRYMLNARCAAAGVPLVDGGLGNDFETSCTMRLQVLDAATGPCYACTLRARARKACEQFARGREPGCAAVAQAVDAAGGVPTSVVTAAIVGAMQVMEGVKLVSDDPSFPAARNYQLRLRFGRSPDQQVVQRSLRLHDACPHHESFQPAESTRAVPGCSASLTLDGLLDGAARAFELPRDDVRLRLPFRLYASGYCSACETQHCWIPEFRALVAANLLDNRPDAPLPADLRLACGCPRGRGRAHNDPAPLTTYRARKGPCDRTLRQLSLPWRHGYPVLDARGIVGYVTPIGDRERLGW